MRSFLRGVLVLFVIAGAASCENKRQMPTAPSAAAPLAAQTLDWDCGRQSAVATSGWTVPTGGAACPGQTLAQQVGVGLITAAPGNLRSTITGTTVRLEWNPVPEPVTSFRIEAGSATALSDLAILNTGNTLTILTVANVPAGAYSVRVRAVGTDGIPGPPSNEIVVRVGVACAAVPGAPTGFAAQVIGNQVALSWTAPTGDAPSSYVIEAGTTAGLSNIMAFDTGTAATTLTAAAPIGTYYARLRARNTCGLGSPSNEVVISVGASTPTPLPTPTPSPVPPTPTPRLPPVAPPPTSPVEPVVPGTPPIEQVIPVPPVVTTPAGPAQVQLVSGGRPNAGAGPIVSVVVNPSTPTAPHVVVTGSVPFDRAVISIDLPTVPDTRLGSALVTEAYFDVRLPQPQITMDVVLPVATTRPFTLQVAVSANGGRTFGAYASTPLGSAGSTQLFTDRASFLANTTGSRVEITFDGIAAPGQFSNLQGGLVGGVRFQAENPSRPGFFNLSVVNPAGAANLGSYDAGSGPSLTLQPVAAVLQVALPSGATALGFECFVPNALAGGNLRVTLASGEQFSIPTPRFPQRQFIGFVSRTPIATITIAPAGGYCNYDNIIVTSGR